MVKWGVIILFVTLIVSAIFSMPSFAKDYATPSDEAAKHELAKVKWVRDLYVSPGCMNVGVISSEKDWSSPTIGKWICGVLAQNGSSLTWVRFVDIEAVVNGGKSTNQAEIFKCECQNNTGSASSTADTPNQAKVLVHNIAGKTPQEVAKILGNPTKKEVVKPSGTPCPCDNLTYKNGEIEIVFIKGRADWITIESMDDANYNKSSLSLLGIAARDPDLSNSNVMRWFKIDGLQEVSFFPSGQKIYYAYIKAVTP